MTLPNIFQLHILIPWIISMLVGILVGGTPGLTATMAVALIVPITYYMDPLAGLAMILGVSFTSSKKGKGSLALTIDLICSAIGGLVGVLLLIIIAPPLAKFALKFTNFQYFWLGMFGLSMSAVLSTGNNVRGLISAVLGLLVSTVGIDITTGFPRFTFGNIELMGGIGFIPVMVGLFGVSEVFKNVKSRDRLIQRTIHDKINVSLFKTLLIVWEREREQI